MRDRLSCSLGEQCLVLSLLFVTTSGHITVSFAGNDKIPFFSLLLLPPSIISEFSKVIHLVEKK